MCKGKKEEGEIGIGEIQDFYFPLRGLFSLKGRVGKLPLQIKSLC